MISNTLKINAIILFAVVLAASGGALIKQKTKIVDSYTNLKSNPLLSNINIHPQLKFHPQSQHYIYNFNTVENTDKPEFKALASKLSQLPSNFPSKINLTTVSASSVVSSEVLNQGELLTNRELYLISKYWLQLLPQFHPELLKCLAGPTAKPQAEAGGDQFPSNCPSTLKFSKPHTESTQQVTSSSSNSQNPSFSLPSSLYKKHQNISNPCTNCTKPNSCKCFDFSLVTTGPDFFTPGTTPSNFHYPNPTSNQSPLPSTFNATNGTKPQSYLSLPHFSFPLPHSSHTPSKTKNPTISITPNQNNSPHWPQPIPITNLFKKSSNNSLKTLVSNLLASPSSFNYSLSSFEETSTSSSSSNITLNPYSPNQLFFVRYLATLYALLWSYSPDSLPLFPSNYSPPTIHPSSRDTIPLYSSLPRTQQK